MDSPAYSEAETVGCAASIVNKWLRSAVVSLGYFTAVLAALKLVFSGLEETILQLANSWHRLKGTESVRELGADMVSAGGIALSLKEVISWPLALSFAVTIPVTIVLWHRLITLPRSAERKRIRDRVATRTNDKAIERKKVTANDS